MIADSTNIDALKEAGIGNVDHAIVAIGQNLFDHFIIYSFNLR